MAEDFPALLLEDRDGRSAGRLTRLTLDDLPDLDVTVEIAFSTLNYKDGLAITGRGKIARRMPLIGGVDLAGTVVSSRDPVWKPGDRVVVNGFGLSETEHGGYSRFQRLKPEWLMRLPDAFTFEQAMGIGTAGYTAALAVDALEAWGAGWGRFTPGEREVLVTGAAGGVGSMAVMLLARAGHTVTAATGRPETHDYLAALGASGFIDRAALAEKGAPLQKERWLGGVDSVGSTTLANALAQTARGGAIAACGLAGGGDLPATVMPHILRGVGLIGIDSVMADMPRREVAWARLARDLPLDLLEKTIRVEPMSALPQLAEEILVGRIRGRVVIDISR
ncbi:NADPH:quinone dehydrogenase [Xaviernesmea oryzae]|uniref:NADPH:quinone dehydrogenase n=1 Tax=Xaviernesmea oryzae TaxID=464029 RepID=A0A1Q9AXT5_9HYPH|nr:MDR family oxidoreductase [Xaviernesmea oryzae]OLP60253.1 NADPH:quinone dehydrogenase [Xaviernesmea oryzae]SEK26268.1 putative quinone oxidoreductase, YhdH/YhfP family [Xaviernesmea oryzae]